MNKKLLYKHLDNYLSKIKNETEINDFNERLEREEYYKSYTADKIVSMNEEEFYEYISKLWAMIIWGNKEYIINKSKFITKIYKVTTEKQIVEIVENK